MSILAGDETLVNTYTTSSQYVQQIETLVDGGWVAVWISIGQDGDSWGIYQQAFNADGSTLGGEVQVNTYFTSYQQYPDVVAVTNRGWVVNWTSDGQDGDGVGVYQQAYNADGTPQGSEVRVNTETTDNQYGALLAALTDGGWVSVYASQEQDGSSGGVYQQAYNADGSVQGDEIRVNSHTANSQSNSKALALPGGGWIVVWDSIGQDGNSYGIYLQAFNADGTFRGDETRVNTETIDAQLMPSIDVLASGGWVVTWESLSQDGDHLGVYQQAFHADGTVLGIETQVNTYTTSFQDRSIVTGLADGGWVVVWLSDGQDGFGVGLGVFQQAFNADGTARGSETQVNTHIDHDQKNHRVAALEDGGWVVVWESEEVSGIQYVSYLQAYNSDGSKRGDEIVVSSLDDTSSSLPTVAAIGKGDWVVSWNSVVEGVSDVHMKVFRSVEDMTLIGTKGRNKLNGDWGVDTLDGRGGNDTLKGFDGKDQLLGGKGKDQLFGGGGDDTLEGGKGRDVLKGQAGLDVFVFNKRDGKDTLLGFKNGQDTFDFQSMGYKHKAQALKHFYEIGGKNNNKVGFDHKGVEIVVTGLDLKDINGSDLLV